MEKQNVSSELYHGTILKTRFHGSMMSHFAGIQRVSASGQSFVRGCALQSCLRAGHTYRPYKMRPLFTYFQSLLGISASKSLDILVKSVLLVRLNRHANRRTCVSVGIPSQISNSSPKTTWAVLYPTPGRVWRFFASLGTFPPKSEQTFFADKIICFALFLKNGTDEISFWKVAGTACAKSLAVLYFLKRCFVSRFTALSVHCADNITATTN